jgi:ribosomal protein L29
MTLKKLKYMDIQEIKAKLASATDDEIKQILCSVIDQPSADMKIPELKSLLREYKDHLLEIKAQAREHIDSNGKIPLKWA